MALVDRLTEYILLLSYLKWYFLLDKSQQRERSHLPYFTKTEAAFQATGGDR
ncbi:MAG TPA: hypothetical protein V6D12_12500 [Candidatus Obscuribacterales bacterium]